MVFPEIPERASDKPWRSIQDLREGELVFYPTHGVGHIEKLRDVTAAGYSLKVFEVIFWNDNRKLSIPVNKAESSGLRRLLTPEHFQRAIDVLKSPRLSPDHISQQKILEIKDKVFSGDPLKMSEVVRDFLIIAETTDQLKEKKSLVQMAFDNLVREFSAIHRINLVDAAQNIRSLMVSDMDGIWPKNRDLSPNAGYIYLLKNPAFPKLLKIGYTNRNDIEDRVRELSASSGVPYPFVVVFSQQVRNAKALELDIHEKFSSYRTNNRREFFEIDSAPVIKYILSFE
jgi:CarD family transcriptional regulator